MEIKVSVVIPVYNSERFLRECLDCVTNQTLREIEILCIDDGSEDASMGILEEYAARDARLRILRQSHGGAGTARNLGMSEARGRYLSFLDSDDRFEPDMLEKMYLEAQRLGTDILVCRADRFLDGREEHIGFTNIAQGLLPSQRPFSSKDVDWNFFGNFVWWVWDKLYLRSFVERVGVKFQEIRTTNDVFFSAAMMLRAERISCMDEVLIHQRLRGDSLTGTRDRSYDCFYSALRGIRDFMVEQGMYEDRKQDFVNHCVHFCLEQLETLPDETSKKLAALFREEAGEELGLLGYGEFYFYRPEEYRRFLNRVGTGPSILSRDVGYRFLYPLCRLLSACRPGDLLEFHLDSSTGLVAEYAARAGARHLVLESRSRETAEGLISRWGFPPARTEVRGDALARASRPGELGVVYGRFADLAGKGRYDLILLKCPPGGGELSHMDLLPLLPGILKEEFALLMDHTETRFGGRVFRDMAKILEEHGIPFLREDFPGKDGMTSLLVSRAWRQAMGYLPSVG